MKDSTAAFVYRPENLTSTVCDVVELPMQDYRLKSKVPTGRHVLRMEVTPSTQNISLIKPCKGDITNYTLYHPFRIVMMKLKSPRDSMTMDGGDSIHSKGNTFE